MNDTRDQLFCRSLKHLEGCSAASRIRVRELILKAERQEELRGNTVRSPLDWEYLNALKTCREVLTYAPGDSGYRR